MVNLRIIICGLKAKHIQRNPNFQNLHGKEKKKSEVKLQQSKSKRSRKRLVQVMGLMHNYVIQCMGVRLGGIAKQVPPFFRECVFHTYWLQVYLFNSETVRNTRRIKFNPPRITHSSANQLETKRQFEPLAANKMPGRN